MPISSPAGPSSTSSHLTTHHTDLTDLTDVPKAVSFRSRIREIRVICGKKHPLPGIPLRFPNATLSPIIRAIKTIIRQALVSDAPVIAEFNRRLAAETENLHLDPDCVAAGVTALLQDPAKGIYYVAEVDSTVVGQLMITYEWSDWRNGNLWWIQSVYVKAEFRGTGIFRQLFQHVKSLAQAQKEVRALRLYMHSENSRARRAYENLGMQHTHYEVFEMELGAD